MDFGQYLPDVGDLGVIGFILIWAHRITTKTIPKMTERFMAAIEQQRNDFKETLSLQRGDFATELEWQRKVDKEQTDRILEYLKDRDRR